MKKTCGALVISLMITANVYATEEKLPAYCGENPASEIGITIRLMKHYDPALENWQPAKDVCSILRDYTSKVYQDGTDHGASLCPRQSSKTNHKQTNPDDFDRINSIKEEAKREAKREAKEEYELELENQRLLEHYGRGVR